MSTAAGFHLETDRAGELHVHGSLVSLAMKLAAILFPVDAAVRAPSVDVPAAVVHAVQCVGVFQRTPPFAALVARWARTASFQPAANPAASSAAGRVG